MIIRLPRRLDVPDADRAIPANGIESIAPGGEGQLVDGPVVSFQRSKVAPLQVPDPDRLVETRRRQEPSVRRIDDAAHVAGMALKDMAKLTRVGVPDPDRVVPRDPCRRPDLAAGRGQGVPVRRIGHAEGLSPFGSVQRPQLGPLLDVPDARGAVVAGRGEGSAPLGEGDPVDKAIVPAEGLQGPVCSAGFTGSTEVGKILYQQAAVGAKKLGLELGGNAPFVVFDDADIDAAVEGAMVSKYRNMGQTCVCANRIYAQDKIYDQFVEKLSKKVAAMKIGDGTEAGVTQGPLINMEAIDKVEKHIADAVKGGAKIVTGGKRHALGGSFFEPTVLANVEPDALVAHEETFGPLAPVFRFKDEADVIAMCNNSPFGLASYFYSRDLGRVWRVAEALESGMVGVNTGLITTEVAPFGGVKESGLGPRRLASRHGRICRDQIRDDGGDLRSIARPGLPHHKLVHELPQPRRPFLGVEAGRRMTVARCRAGNSRRRRRQPSAPASRRARVPAETACRSATGHTALST